MKAVFLDVEQSDIGKLMPELRGIFYGDCGGDSIHYDKHPLDAPLGGAHTHMCPLDPIYKHICVSELRHILNEDGSPSNLIVHEYGHVLQSFPMAGLPGYKCVGPKGKHSVLTFEGINEVLPAGWEHGKEWQDIVANRLGRPDIAMWGTTVVMGQSAALIK